METKKAKIEVLEEIKGDLWPFWRLLVCPFGHQVKGIYKNLTSDQKEAT